MRVVASAPKTSHEKGATPGAAHGAGQGGAPDPMADEAGQEGWSPLRLVAVAAGTLLVALAVIVWLGSRYEGCVYVDGARPGHALGR